MKFTVCNLSVVPILGVSGVFGVTFPATKLYLNLQQKQSNGKVILNSDVFSFKEFALASQNSADSVIGEFGDSPQNSQLQNTSPVFVAFGFPVRVLSYNAAMELTDPGVIVGYLAAALVFSSFYMKTMLPLRLVAIASNIGFLSYGAMNNLTPILILHAILLPLNIVRSWEICRTLSRIRKTRSSGLPLETILPLMTPGQKCRGEMLFRRGDKADRLYILTTGEIQLQELNLTILPGSFCGEIGLFSPQHRRTATAVCATDVTFHSLTNDQVDSIFYQNPDFGYALLGILTHRLVENAERLESRLRILGRPGKTEKIVR